MERNFIKLNPKAVADRETGIITAIADIKATPERVYCALTTKEMEEWWGLEDVYRVINLNADLRIGGQWSFLVVRPDGQSFPASGQFLELHAPHKIEISRRYDWDAPGLGRAVTTVAYLVDPIDCGTRLTIRHSGFENCAEAAYEHAEGWERLLNWLRNYLEAR